MPYIKCLTNFSEIDEVWVIVPEIDMQMRKAMGWSADCWMKNEDIKFLVNPSRDEIVRLLRKFSMTDTWCIFSGINSFSLVSDCFRLSLRYRLKRGVITEPPLLYNHPLWLHAIRFALKDWYYVRYIDKLFVMGDRFVPYYRFWSARWDVIPFMYCTEWKDRLSSGISESRSSVLKILYVGALSHRKNVRILLEASQLLNVEQQQKLEIGIVGDGARMKELRILAESERSDVKVQFHGTQPMEKIPEFMQRYDVLCLPSLHDGWGAVVNEALTLGLYVICSDCCGAKYLLTSDKDPIVRGRVFSSDDPYDLKTVIEETLTHKDMICAKVQERIAWAKSHISGEVVAKYFLDNLHP